MFVVSLTVGSITTRTSATSVVKSCVTTAFVIQRDTVSPDKVERMLTLFGKYGSGFGGGHKLSTGRLIPEKVCIVNEELFGQEE